MIHVDPNSWHGRWFKFCAACWAQFTDGRGPDTHRTNLCTFFWTSVGAPLFVLGAHLLVLAFALYTTLWFGVTRLTLVGFAIEVGTIAAFVAILYGVNKGIDMWGERRADRRCRKAQKEKHDGFFTLLIKYMVAAKQRVCPLVNLED